MTLLHLSKRCQMGSIEQLLPEHKIQLLWEPQYGIPAIQDLLLAIPENLSQPQGEIHDIAHGQQEKAQAAYQQWALLAKPIYQVGELQDVDQRIAFLMQLEQQSPNQITQVLTQSPAVDELLKRDRTYAQSYSEFCQSYARDNHTTWQTDLDQYRRAVEIERQQQEQRRIALERQLIQQQERKHDLELLGQWQKSAISLGRPISYVERILKVTADYQRGLPLSEKTIKARQEDLAAYQIHMQLKQGELSL